MRLTVCNEETCLILCTGNSARSQMTEGLLCHDATDRFEGFSAGVEPAAEVRPEAVVVMGELGIDISGHRPKHVDELAGEPFDYVLTVCDHARETCPLFPGSTITLHRSFVDPGCVPGTDGERLAMFRKVGDELPDYLRTFPPQLDLSAIPHRTSFPFAILDAPFTMQQVQTQFRTGPWHSRMF